ncbi:MAG TPA: ABC transporter ATP-binding protein [Vicinamibacterales bacterium]|nr:ABC transporter ATP-binding protein [Vicinamibacterales bacterium]
MAAAIETSNLTRRFGRTEAVERLSLEIPERSVFALIGPNGAGKTTTIKVLLNLLRPTRGSARILGCDTTALSVRELQRIGYVSENQRLPGWMTPAQLVAYCRPLYPTWDEAFARELQTSLGLTARTPIRTLSRGTRMKAALLLSLAYRPDLIVLDEPFTGLDPLVRDELIRALLGASADGPVTVLVSSHDIDEVERLADWIGYIDGGRLVFAEPTASLLSRFRLVEVVSDAAGPVPAGDPRWIVQGVSGRTLRFVDTAHADADADLRIAAAFPGAKIRTSPLPLRDIFVTLASRAAAHRIEEAV